MKRIELVRLLEGVCEVSLVSSLKAQVKANKIVLQYGGTTSSLQNPLCGWDNWDLILLVPSKSIIVLDMLEENVRNILKHIEGIEFILDGWGGEHYDDTIKAYYKTIRFRLPHEFTN